MNKPEQQLPQKSHTEQSVDVTYEKDLPANEADLFQLAHYPLLDVAEGVKINGSEEALTKLLKLVIDNQIVMQDVERMRSAYQAEDWKAVQAIAHKIKGGALYIGTLRMKMACQYLERYWKVGRRSALEKLYQQLLLVIDDTHLAISDWLTKSN